MRTSGAANDGPLTYVPVLAAVLIVVLLLGGPSSTVRLLDRFLGQFFETVVSVGRAIASIF
jgi:hypothetical protein